MSGLFWTLIGACVGFTFAALAAEHERRRLRRERDRAWRTLDRIEGALVRGEDATAIAFALSDVPDPTEHAEYYLVTRKEEIECQ